MSYSKLNEAARMPSSRGRSVTTGVPPATERLVTIQSVKGPRCWTVVPPVVQLPLARRSIVVISRVLVMGSSSETNWIWS